MAVLARAALSFDDRQHDEDLLTEEDVRCGGTMVHHVHGAVKNDKERLVNSGELVHSLWTCHQFLL